MQDHFLFNDDDPKQRGHGIDVVRKKGDGLKADWKWTRGRGAQMPHTNKRCIGQVSEAEISEAVTLEAIFWHTHYEAAVNRLGENLAAYSVDPRDARRDFDNRFEEEGRPLLTRVDAQRKAEQLAREFVTDFDKELRAAGL